MDRTRSDGTAGQDRTGPDQTGPDRTGPDRTGPDQARPGQARPGQAGTGRDGAGRGGTGRNWTGRMGWTARTARKGGRTDGTDRQAVVCQAPQINCFKNRRPGVITSKVFMTDWNWDSSSSGLYCASNRFMQKLTMSAVACHPNCCVPVPACAQACTCACARSRARSQACLYLSHPCHSLLSAHPRARLGMQLTMNSCAGCE